jgi:hypothetical protein
MTTQNELTRFFDSSNDLLYRDNVMLELINERGDILEVTVKDGKLVYDVTLDDTEEEEE